LKKQIKYFISAFILIFFSSPLGYKTINVIYYNKNLTGEYVPLLNGSIYSYMIIGILIFILGLANMFLNKEDK
jgi:hypothetical protein